MRSMGSPSSDDAAIADAEKARHRAAQSRHRETALPAQLHLVAQRLDHGIDEGQQVLRLVEGRAADALLGHAEDDDALRHVDLGCGKAGAADVGQRLVHVGDEAAHVGRARIGHRRGCPRSTGWPMRAILRMAMRGIYVLPPPSQTAAFMVFENDGCALFAAGFASGGRKGDLVQVLVRDNNVDQALRALKKKMQREGIFREMKLRRNYEKPSERRARETAEAVRRYRKLLRKRLEREGY